MQVDVAAQVDGTREEPSLRYRYASASGRGAGGHSASERLGAIGASVTTSAVGGDGELTIRESWRIDARENGRDAVPSRRERLIERRIERGLPTRIATRNRGQQRRPSSGRGNPNEIASAEIRTAHRLSLCGMVTT